MIDDTLQFHGYKKITRDLREIKVSAFGRIKYLSDWSRESGVSSSSIRGRIAMGWSPEKALTTPKLHHGKDSTFLSKKDLFKSKFISTK